MNMMAFNWGSWMHSSWDPEEPACVRCYTSRSLLGGCEWSDHPELNLCHHCALTVLEKLRPLPEMPLRRFIIPQQHPQDTESGVDKIDI